MEGVQRLELVLRVSDILLLKACWFFNSSLTLDVSLVQNIINVAKLLFLMGTYQFNKNSE